MATKKPPPKRSRTPANKRWVKNVTTDSTHPPERLFTKSPAEIARALASKEVSPKGPVSGMRMLTFFINRAGKGLSPTRRARLEKAKDCSLRKSSGGKKPPELKSGGFVKHRSPGRWEEQSG